MSQDTAERLPTQVVAISNQKGGVGKTTTAVNLAAALCELGQQVLVIDLDPQGNASTSLGIDRPNRGDGTYSLIAGRRGLNAVARPAAIGGLRVVAAEPGLSGAEVELATAERREHRLADALAPLAGHPDRPAVVLIDCPPSLGLLTLNALVAADAVLVPMQCEFFALEGLSQTTATLDKVRSSLNPRLALNGIVLTMADSRNNLSRLVEADVRGFFGGHVYQTVIPRNVRLSEAPSHGRSVLDYDPHSSGAAAYRSLAREFLDRSRNGR